MYKNRPSHLLASVIVPGAGREGDFEGEDGACNDLVHLGLSGGFGQLERVFLRVRAVTQNDFKYSWDSVKKWIDGHRCKVQALIKELVQNLNGDVSLYSSDAE